MNALPVIWAFLVEHQWFAVALFEALGIALFPLAWAWRIAGRLR